VVGAVALAAGAVVGVAGATPSSPTDPTVTALSPVKKLLSGASLATSAVNSPVASGGSTTVPTDATAVQLVVSVKSTRAGSLLVYPFGRAGAASADSIGFPAGSVLVTATIKTEIGNSNKISFKNAGTAAATVSATITGYVLPQGGGTQGFLHTELPAHYITNAAYTTVSQLTVPGGTYLVVFNDDGYNLGNDLDGIECVLRGPSGLVTEQAGVELAPATSGMIVVQGMLTTSGGTISALCEDDNNTAEKNYYYGEISAVQVSTVGAGSDTFSVRPTSRPSLLTKPGVPSLTRR
jgi:hypothetical protein